MPPHISPSLRRARGAGADVTGSAEGAGATGAMGVEEAVGEGLVVGAAFCSLEHAMARRATESVTVRVMVIEFGSFPL